MRTISALLITAAVAAALAAPTAEADSPRFRVQGGGDATLRNGPPARGVGYVIGNALAARPGHRGVAFDQVTVRGFRYGKVHGNVMFCAWISPNAQLQRTGTVQTPRCPGGSAGRVLPANRFMLRLSNAKLLRNCEPGQCSDGSKARVLPSRCAQQYPDGVPAYGNAQPWRTKAAPHDQYATIRASVYQVRWRYVSRDGQWVMVRDPHERNGGERQRAGFDQQASDWYFLPRACVFDNAGKLH